MKIATVTLNPAIDQTVRVDDFRPNAVNRGQAMQFDAGGKGINVASFLADAGYAVAATGFLGQRNTEIFEQFFAHKRIDDYFMRIPGRTRIGVKIIDETNRQTTDINMPGQSPPEEAIQMLLMTIEQLSVSCDWFVLSGGLPPGVPTTIYATIINLLKKCGKQVVLDTSYQALQEGIQTGPTIVKPNLDELQQIVGRPLQSETAIEQVALQLLDDDIRLVVISMGEKGAMFVDQHTTLIATPPQVDVKSTVGAGDAMVAGLIVGQIQGLSLADCARLATAFSIGAITHIGSHLPGSDVLQKYFHTVSVHVRTRVPRSV